MSGRRLSPYPSLNSEWVIDIVDLAEFARGAPVPADPS